MRTADLTSRPKALDWLVYCQENKLLTASEWALAAILVTLGQGQNITMSITGMADILHMKRDTVSNAIDGLTDKGLMVVKGHGRNNKTVYRLTIPLPHCPNGDQSTAQMGTSKLPESGPVDCPNGDHNIEEEDEEREAATSTSGDDVAASTSTPSGRTRDRAKSSSADEVPGQDEGYPDLLEYVSDLEGCLEALAIRLGVGEDSIDVKPLAKMFRALCVRYAFTCMMSDVIEAFPVSTWSRISRKHTPVGYLLNEIEQTMIKQNKETDADDSELEARFLELFAGSDYLPGWRISELMPDVDFETSMALINRLLDEGRIAKISSPPNSYKLAA